MTRTRLKNFLILSLCSCFLLVACHKKMPVFDSQLIYGKWVSGTEYYRFDSDGNGVTWDTSDDVTEEEAQPFTWQFDGTKNTLTVVHKMDMGGSIPKSYTVTMLNVFILSIKDRYGQTFVFNRVN